MTVDIFCMYAKETTLISALTFENCLESMASHYFSCLGLSNKKHMCLVGRLNPYKLLQSWELTFLIGLTLLNTKLAKKNFFTDIL